MLGMSPVQLAHDAVRRTPRAEEHPEPITVLVVDDHPAVRAGVSGLLAEEPDLRVVGQAATAEQAINAVAGVDVAVVDYQLGDRNGLWVAGQLRRDSAPTSVLVYSAFSDAVLAVLVRVAGADGLLSKAAIGDELCTAVRRLAAGGQYLPRVSMPVAGAMRAQLPDPLRAGFDMLVQGISTDHIQEALRIAPPELDAARTAILDALAPTFTPEDRAAATSTALRYDRPFRQPWSPGGVRPRSAP
jgi:DNA-binding NarL/FixJ family response regulator